MLLGLVDLVKILRPRFKRRPKRRTRKRHLDCHIREAEVRILLSGRPTEVTFTEDGHGGSTAAVIHDTHLRETVEGSHTHLYPQTHGPGSDYYSATLFAVEDMFDVIDPTASVEIIEADLTFYAAGGFATQTLEAYRVTTDWVSSGEDNVQLSHRDVTGGLTWANGNFSEADYDTTVSGTGPGADWAQAMTIDVKDVLQDIFDAQSNQGFFISGDVGAFATEISGSYYDGKRPELYVKYQYSSANSAPTINSVTADITHPQVGEQVQLTVSATDAESNPLTYAWTAPAGVTLSDATISNPTFVIQPNDAGQALNFSVTVSDGTDDTVGNVTVNVSSVLPELTLTLNTASIAEDGSTTATVSRPNTLGDLVVTLSSNDATAATLPSQITIYDGNTTSAAFAISGVQDGVNVGTRTVAISATATGYAPSQLVGQSDAIAGFTFDDGLTDDVIATADGSLIGGASVVLDSEYGQVLDLSSSSARLELPVEFGANDADFSIAFWVKLDTAGLTFLTRKGDDLWLGQDPNGGDNTIAAYMGSDLSGTSWDSTNTIPLDDWTHLALVRNGNNGELYIDGQLDSAYALTTSVTTFENGEPLVIGDSLIASDASFDDYYVFDRALSSVEVATLATQHAGTGSTQTVEVTNVYVDPAPVITSMHKSADLYYEYNNGLGHATGTVQVSVVANDPEGQGLSYSWSQTSGTPTTYDDLTLPAPTFNIGSQHAGQTLQFSVDVSDGNTMVNDAIDVVIPASNYAPVISAGNVSPTTTPTIGTLVTLSASVTDTESTGSELRYEWTSPLGVHLSDASAASPTFTTSAEHSGQTLEFSVVVTDPVGASDTGSVTIVPNSAPVIVSTTTFPDPAKVGSPVFLNVTATDHDALTYVWTALNNPGLQLTNANTANASFIPDSSLAGQSVTLRATVTDTIGQTVQSDVIVAVNASAPSSTETQEVTFRAGGSGNETDVTFHDVHLRSYDTSSDQTMYSSPNQPNYYSAGLIGVEDLFVHIDNTQDVQILDATLTLIGGGPNSSPFNVYRVTSNWMEGGESNVQQYYQDLANGAPWQGGSHFSAADYDGSVYGSGTGAGWGFEMPVDVTDVVQDMFDNDLNQGFYVDGLVSNLTSEYPTVSYRPKLYVKYQYAGPPAAHEDSTNVASLALDGNDAIRLDSSKRHLGTSDRTITAWFRTAKNDNDLQTILANGTTTAGNQQHLLGVKDGKLYFNMNVTGRDHQVIGQTFVADGQWHCLTVTMDRDGSAKLYLDGGYENEVDISDLYGLELQNNSSNRIDIGQDGDGTSRFVGELDEIIVVDEILTPDQNDLAMHLGAAQAGPYFTAAAAMSIDVNDPNSIAHDMSGNTLQVDFVDAPMASVDSPYLGNYRDHALWTFDQAPDDRNMLHNARGPQYTHSDLTIGTAPTWFEESSDGYSLQFSLAPNVPNATKQAVVDDRGDFDLLPNEDLSVSFWFKTDTLAAKHDLISKPGLFDVGMHYSSLVAGFNGQSYRTAPAFDSSFLNTWHHAAFSVDRDGVAKLYLDGEQTSFIDFSADGLTDSFDVSESRHLNLTSTDFILGGYIQDLLSNTSGVNFQLDDVQIYNVALDETMVSDVMAGSHALSDHLKAHWSFDNQDIESIVINSSGQTTVAYQSSSNDGQFLSQEPLHYALEFDGVDDAVDFYGQLDMNSDHRTISFRFKHASANQTGIQPLITNGTDLTNQQAIYLDNGVLTVDWADLTTAGTISSSGPISNLQSWHDVEVTFDRAGNVELTIDGVSQTAIPIGIARDADWRKVSDNFTLGGVASGATGDTRFWLDNVEVCDEPNRHVDDDGSAKYMPMSASITLDLPAPTTITAGQPFQYDISAFVNDENGNPTGTPAAFELLGHAFAQFPDGSVESVPQIHIANTTTGAQLKWNGAASEFAGATIHAHLRRIDCGDGQGAIIPLEFPVSAGVHAENHAPRFVGPVNGDLDGDGTVQFRFGSGTSQSDKIIRTSGGTEDVDFQLHNLANGASQPKIDLFFLIEDNTALANAQFTVDNDNQASLARFLGAEITSLSDRFSGIDFAVGVGHVGGYGGLQPNGLPWSFQNDADDALSALEKPFVLNRAIGSVDNLVTNGSLSGVNSWTLANSGLAYENNAIFEALYQIATGIGFDGDQDGSVLGGPNSGDIAPVWSHSELNSFTTGGVGWRDDAVKIIVPLTSTPPTAEASPQEMEALEDVLGVENVPWASFFGGGTMNTPADVGEPTSPFRSGVKVQEAIDAVVNDLGALVVPIYANANSGSQSGNTSGLSLLTGAADATGLEFLNGEGDWVVSETLGELVESLAYTPVATSISPILSGGSLQSGINAPLSGGEQAPMTLTFTTDGDSHFFPVQLVQQGTNRLISDDVYTVIVDNHYLYVPHAIDPDGDPLQYEVSIDGGAFQEVIDGRVEIDLDFTNKADVSVVAKVFDLDVNGQKIDASNSVDTQTFKITPIDIDSAANLAPTITNPPEEMLAVASPGSSIEFRVTAQDPEGDPLRFFLGAGAPKGMTINPVTGLITWTAAGDKVHSNRAIDVHVADPFGKMDREVLFVNFSGEGVNTAPEIRWAGRRALTVGDVYVSNVTAYDAESDELTFAISNAPAGLHTNADTGDLIWQVGQHTKGDHVFTVTVTDDKGAQDIFDWHVSVFAADPIDFAGLPQGSAPQFLADTPPVARLGSSYEYYFQVVDPDGYRHEQQGNELKEVGAPELTVDHPNMSVTKESSEPNELGYHTYKLTWSSPTGSLQPVTLMAVDDEGESETLSIDIRVVDENTAPVIVTPDTYLISPSKKYSSEIIYYDSENSSPIATYEILVDGDNIRSGSLGASGSLLEWTPEHEHVGKIATLVIRVNDSTLVAEKAVSMPVVSQAPFQVGQIPDQYVAPGTTDFIPIRTFNAVKVDQDIEFSLRQPDGTLPPWWITLNGNEIEIDVPEVTNDLDVRGRVYDLIAAATDDAGRRHQVQFSVSVVDNPPTVTPPPMPATNVVDENIRKEFDNFALSFTDLQVAVGNIPITITRSYDSNDYQVDGEFGLGWSLDIANVDIAVSHADLSTNPTVALDRGSQLYFTLPGGQIETFEYTPNPAFELLGIGLTTSLIPKFTETNQTGATLEILGNDDPIAQVDEYKPLEDPNVTFKLTTQAGVSYYITTSVDAQQARVTGRISEIVTRHGSVTIQAPNLGGTSAIYSGDNEDENAVTLHWNSAGHITQIEDPNENSIYYTYDNDELESVKTSSTGADGVTKHGFTTFEYKQGSLGLLEKVKTGASDAQGTDGVNAFTVDIDNNGKIQSFTDAAGQTLTYGHTQTSNTFSESVTDADDRLLSESVYDGNGNLIREINRVKYDGSPTYQVTVHEYNAYSRLVRSYEPFMATAIDKLSKMPGADTWVVENEYADVESVSTYHQFPQTLVAVYTRGANGERVLSSRFSEFDDLGLPGAISTPLGTTRNVYDHRGRLTSTQDPSGTTTDFEYVEDGDTETTWVKNDTGYLSKTVVTNGLVTSVTQFPLDDDPNTPDVEDPNFGHDTTQYFAYDKNGNQTLSYYHWKPNTGNYKTVASQTIYDELGRVVTTHEHTLEFAPAENLLLTLAVGTDNSLKYFDSNGTLTTIPEGPNDYAIVSLQTSATEYNQLGQVSKTANAFGEVTHYKYDRRGNLNETIVDIDDDETTTNMVSRTAYDAFGRPTHSTDVHASNASVTPGTHTVYDDAGRSIKSERYGDIDITIDANGDASATMLNSDLLSTTETFYDEQGRVQFLAQYDASDPHISNNDIYGNVTESKYNSLGQLDSTVVHLNARIDGNNEVAYFEVDANGKSRHPVIQTEYEYDSIGRQIKVTDAHGHFTRTEYDKLGRASKTTFHDGSVTTAQYNALGQRISQTAQHFEASSDLDLEAISTHYRYDAQGRLAYVILPKVPLHNFDDTSIGANPINVHPVYRYQYDRYGNQISISDHLYRTEVDSADVNLKARTTEFEFDESQRQVRRILDAGGADLTEEFQFNDHGQLEQHTSFEGVVTNYVYNGSRIHTVDYIKGPNIDTFTFQYDDLGRVESVDQDFANGDLIDTQTIYDEFGRVDLITTSTAISGAPNTTTTFIDYEYDATTGLLTSTQTSKDIESNTITEEGYAYDELGRLSFVRTTKQAGQSLGDREALTLYMYDNVGNLKSVVSGEELTSDQDNDIDNYALASYYQYDALNRLTHLAHFNGVEEGDAMLSYSYELAPDGKRQRVTEERAKEINGGIERRIDTTDWSYDNLGRLIEETYTFDPSSSVSSYTSNYTFDLVGNRKRYQKTGEEDVFYHYNALDQLTSEVTSSGTTTYSYEGTQQTQKDATTYSYNLQGRLAEVDGTKYAYNANGIRVAETDSGNSTKTFIVDPHNHTGYAQIREELTGGQIDRSYSIGHDVIMQKDSAEANYDFFVYDGHGSTRALAYIDDGNTNQTTKIDSSQLFDYAPYGERLDNNDARTSILFSGEQTDANTGLQYLRARYYDPSNGRFNRLDPFAGNMQDPQSLHKYLYAHANPVMNIDPTGLFTIVGSLSANSFASTLSGLEAGAGFDVLSAADAVRTGKTVEQVLLEQVVNSALLGGGAVAVGAVFKILSRGAVRIANSGVAPNTNAIFALAEISIASQRAMRGYLPQLRAIANDVRIGVRGSVARGLRGPQKNFDPLDAANFDVDAFIISDTLATANQTRIVNGFRFSTDGRIRTIQRDIQRVLSRQFPGMKGGRDRFTFRIFTQDEFNRISGSPHFFVD